MSVTSSAKVNSPLLDNCRGSFARANADYLRGMASWRIWLGLGLQDIRIRYKRTILGPLWMTVSQAVTFSVMGMLFSAVLRNDVRHYLPYLGMGMVTWGFLAAMAAEGPRIFVESHHLINAMRMPLVVHVLRCLIRNGVVFFHNLAAAMAAYFILGGELKSTLMLSLLTLPLLFATAFAGALILAVLGARFRDLVPSVAVITQIMFFMTPIMWRLEDLPQASKWWVYMNPAYHVLEVVRAPLLGESLQIASLIVAGAVAVVLNLCAWGVFCTFRRRISYWI